jgi:transcriptional regulator with XRE-family HTH domain
MPKAPSDEADDVLQARVTWERYQTTCKRMGLEGWPTFDDFLADVGVPPATKTGEAAARMVRIDKALAFIPGNVAWDLGRGRGGTMSDETVIAIYTSNEGQAKLAKRYGVSQAMISRIKRGQSYGHVPKPRMITETSAATGWVPVRRVDTSPPSPGAPIWSPNTPAEPEPAKPDDGMIYGEPTDEEEEAYAAMMRDMDLPPE